MNRKINKTSVVLATILAGLTFSSPVMAEFNTQVLNETKGGYSDRDLESGLVANSSLSALGTKISLIESGQAFVVVDSSTIKEDINISNGTLYWSETVFTDGELIATLFSYKNNSITAITSSNTDKSGFSYDDHGNVAWVEQVNNANEIFFYDGVSVRQITSGNVGYSVNDYSKNIHVADGKIVWGQSGAIFLWDGFTTTQITPTNHSINSWTSFDGESVVWIGSNDTVSNEVFQYNSQGLSQVTNVYNSPSGVKVNALIEDNVITFQRSVSSFGFVPKELYTFVNGESVLLSESSVNDAQVDAGNLYWTEGNAADTPTELFEYSNGITTQIETSAGFITGLDADDGFLIWNTINYPNPTTLTIASPVTTTDSEIINLGAEHSFTTLDLSEEITIEVIAGNNWNWDPSLITFGFTSSQQSLDGIVVIDSLNNSYNLNGYWSPVSLGFRNDSITLTIPAQPGKTINVHWWAAGQ
ncbi:hypothetical protein [Marinicellulosiphila megalodicopiae]|uniref:hypothetical protein n=1 Tax=Marinicellulosiphila megalodicopiae TaxID=2724896 RepID=UPI003BB04EB9